MRSLLVAVILLPFFGFGQITLTHNNAPTPGTKVYNGHAAQYIPATVNAGSPGINQSWDFSALVAESNDSLEFVHVDSTDYSFVYPSANLAVENGSASEYYRADSSGLYLMGTAGDFYLSGDTCEAAYTPPYYVMKWPLTYGQSFSDTVDYTLAPCSTSSSTSDSVRIHYQYQYTATADAYGIIQMPAGVYNTIRIKRVISHYDTVWSYYNGNPWYPLYIGYGVYEVYEWWTNDTSVKYQLATLMMDTVNNFASSVSWNETSGTTTSILLKTIAPEIVLYPNPAKNNITIRFGKNESFDMVVYDIFGRPVRKYANVKSGTSMNLDLVPGIYTTSFEREGTQFKGKKLIIE